MLYIYIHIFISIIVLLKYFTSGYSIIIGSNSLSCFIFISLILFFFPASLVPSSTHFLPHCKDMCTFLKIRSIYGECANFLFPYMMLWYISHSVSYYFTQHFKSLCTWMNVLLAGVSKCCVVSRCGTSTRSSLLLGRASASLPVPRSDTDLVCWGFPPVLFKSRPLLLIETLWGAG